MTDKNIKAPQGFHWMKKGKNNKILEEIGRAHV